MHISGYNGADEDEIMDNIFSKFSAEGLTSTGHKTGQKMLMKDDAKLAAGQILEAAHFLKPDDVPDFLNANFESAWEHFDQNHEGWIRYEETHTFQRFIQGKLNKFALAPGSISDITSGANAYNNIVPAGTSVISVGNQWGIIVTDDRWMVCIKELRRNQMDKKCF